MVRRSICRWVGCSIARLLDSLVSAKPVDYSISRSQMSATSFQAFLRGLQLEVTWKARALFSRHKTLECSSGRRKLKVTHSYTNLLADFTRSVLSSFCFGYSERSSRDSRKALLTTEPEISSGAVTVFKDCQLLPEVRYVDVCGAETCTSMVQERVCA